MQFGYFFTMDRFDGASHREIIDFAVEQTKLAEQAGVETVWMGEHHFGGEGYDVHPNPLLTGAYMAAQTDRIRIGLAAAIATEWHPLRLAEDVAALDHLSGGRVECGLGRGITSRELSNLNMIDVDRKSSEERNWEVFLETVEIMKKAWTEDCFTFSGKHYSFPRPGVKDSTAGWYPRNPAWRSEDGQYIGMSIEPKPVQKPYPPLWNTVDKTPGFVIAAEHGMKPITWLRASGALKEAFETYQEAASRIQGRELALGEDCALLRTVFVGETMEEVRKTIEPAVEFVYRDYIGGIRSRQIYAEPGETLSEADNEKPWFDFLRERGFLLVGSPEMVVEQIKGLQEEIGLKNLLAWMWLPYLQHSQIMRSLEIFGAEVLPKLAEEPTRVG